MASWLSCNCLGDTLFGQDVDDVFAYVTPKQVRVKDRSLGLLRISLMLLIFCYIVVFQVGYNGEHFKMEDVEGIARLQWQQPTMNWCNPMEAGCRSNISDAQDLPYCEQSAKAGAEKWVGARQRQCAYKDAFELPIQLAQGVLIPTYFETYRQKRMCEPSASSCLSKYQFEEANSGALQTQRGDAHPSRDFFVAGVEDFTVLIDHSFSTASGRIAHDDYAMQGYWLDCSGADERCIKRPIECVHSKCEAMGFELLQDGCVGQHCGGQPGAPKKPEAPSRHLRQRHSTAGELGLTEFESAANDRDGALAEAQQHKQMKVIALADGDVLSIETMLAMARSSLKSKPPPPGGYSLDDIANSDGETLRLRGAAIVVSIEYDNLDHWRIFTPKDPPTYTISVAMRPAHEFKHLYVSDFDIEGREVTKAYGIMMVVQQYGRIATFNLLHGLVVLTAALGLLAVSNMLTDMMAMYVFPNNEAFTARKFEVTDDMHPMNVNKEG